MYGVSVHARVHVCAYTYTSYPTDYCLSRFMQYEEMIHFTAAAVCTSSSLLTPPHSYCTWYMAVRGTCFLISQQDPGSSDAELLVSVPKLQVLHRVTDVSGLLWNNSHHEV